jgi:hypothetical protein
MGLIITSSMTPGGCTELLLSASKGAAFSASRTDGQLARPGMAAVIIWTRAATRPGTKKFGERVAGLNRTAGRASTMARPGAGEALVFEQDEGVEDVEGGALKPVESEPSTSNWTVAPRPARTRSA